MQRILTVSFWVASMCFDTPITHFWRYNHDQSLGPQLLYYLKFRVLDKMNNYILTSDWIKYDGDELINN